MKKTVKILVAAILVFGCTFKASAQSDYSIQLGGILPLQDFKASPSYFMPGAGFGNNYGAAAFGASIGFKYNYIFPFRMGVFASIDAMWNTVNKDVRNTYDAVSCTKPNYINAPIIVGVNYVSDFSNVVDLWAEAGVGANVMYKTPEGWSDNLTKYNTDITLAAEAGAGVTFVGIVSLGVHYYWLGKQSIENVNITYDETYLVSPKIRTGLLAFKLGFHF